MIKLKTIEKKGDNFEVTYNVACFGFIFYELYWLRICMNKVPVCFTSLMLHGTAFIFQAFFASYWLFVVSGKLGG